ncbi:hypothetical protein V5O48_011807 [Marasmius crinis-equi]|uniref:F-box domain-containing protein n=1 Tax=Marasmius crinis-equi TaxID=585013 RepID=A0ABR3F4H9_9AGAR
MTSSTLLPTLCLQCSYTPTPHLPHPPPNLHHSSSHFLLDNEVAQIRQWIHDEQIQLSLFNGELARIQSVLSDLIQRKTALEARISERQSQIASASLRRIPAELWGEIFRLCLPASSDSGVNAGLALAVSKTDWNKIESVPLTLSHVCSRWRSILLSTPNLWSVLDVNLYELNRDIVPLLNLFFARAQGGMGVDARVRFRRGALGVWRNASRYKMKYKYPGERGESWTGYAEGAFDFVRKRVGEVRMLEVRDVAGNGIPNERLGSLQTHYQAQAQSQNLSPLPLLESLVVDLPVESESESESQLLSTIRNGGAPHLKSVTLDASLCLSSANISSWLASSNAPVETLDIRNVGLFDGQLDDILEVVRGLKELKTLRVSSLRDAFTGSSPKLGVVRNESIRNLDLSNGMCALLEYLDLPNLQSVSVSSGEGTRLHIAELWRILTRFPKLISLSINLDLEERQVSCLADVLHTLPNLTRLEATVKGCGKKSSMVELFSAFSSLRGVGKLEHLSVTELDLGLSVDLADRFVTFLESAQAGLKEVKLAFGGCCYYDVRRVAKMDERLRLIEDRGTRCAFFYESYGARVFLLGARELEGEA